MGTDRQTDITLRAAPTDSWHWVLGRGFGAELLSREPFPGGERQGDKGLAMGEETLVQMSLVPLSLLENFLHNLSFLNSKSAPDEASEPQR